MPIDDTMDVPGSAPCSRRTFVTTTLHAVLAASVTGCTDEDAAPRIRALPQIQSDADVERLLPSLTNWGQWGPDDEMGTLNYITPDRRLTAIGLVRSGRTVSLARTSSFASIERGQHEVTLRPMGSRDFIGMVFHGFEVTHLDGLAHAFANGTQMYNGRPRSAVTPDGAQELGVEAMASGIIGRGVLLDVANVRGGPLVPGTAIYPADLEAAERVHNVTVGPGDILFVRTGAGRANTRDRRSGLHPECLPWLHGRAVAILAGDGDSDVSPLQGFERWSGAMHAVGIPYMGMPIIDNADLEALHLACEDQQQWAFLVTIAPLRIRGMTGSPINPIAVL